MKVRNGSGEHRTKLKKANKKIIEAFFNDNPNSTITECSESTGLSYPTIKSHIKEIRGGE